MPSPAKRHTVRPHGDRYAVVDGQTGGVLHVCELSCHAELMCYTLNRSHQPPAPGSNPMRRPLAETLAEWLPPRSAYPLFTPTQKEA